MPNLPKSVECNVLHLTDGGFMATNHLGYHRLAITDCKHCINLATWSFGKQHITYHHPFDW